MASNGCERSFLLTFCARDVIRWPAIKLKISLQKNCLSVNSIKNWRKYLEHISFISIKQIGSQYNGGWDIINSGWAQFHRGANTYWPAEPRNLFLKQIAFVLQCFWAKTNWPAEPRNLFLKQIVIVLQCFSANTYWPAEPRNLFLKQIVFDLQWFWANTYWPAEPRNLFLKTNCNCFAMFLSKN